jgi:PHD/YefM family antitoxin component YafN of YafNO toxin-antitoxin module
VEIYITEKAQEFLPKIIKDVQEDEDIVWILDSDYKAVVMSEEHYENLMESLRVWGGIANDYLEEQLKDTSSFEEYIPEQQFLRSEII